jgi:hypothetical protein
MDWMEETESPFPHAVVMQVLGEVFSSCDRVFYQDLYDLDYCGVHEYRLEPWRPGLNLSPLTFTIHRMAEGYRVYILPQRHLVMVNQCGALSLTTEEVIEAEDFLCGQESTGWEFMIQLENKQ